MDTKTALKTLQNYYDSHEGRLPDDVQEALLMGWSALMVMYDLERGFPNEEGNIVPYEERNWMRQSRRRGLND